MVLIHSNFLNSEWINQKLILAQASAQPQHQQSSPYYPIELWGSLALVGVAFLAVARNELRRFERRRELEAQQAEKYVRELETENQRLENEIKSYRNTVVALRVKLAASEKEIEISSGELRKRSPKIPS